MSRRTISRAAPSAASNGEALAEFLASEEMRARYLVTDQEASFLETVSLMGTIQGIDDVLFVLKNIRS